MSAKRLKLKRDLRADLELQEAIREAQNVTTPAGLKPWPGEAVIIVAAAAGEERREQMEAVVPAECRDCGRILAADSHTIRLAEGLPSRRGRPVEFLCIACCVTYDRRTVSEFHDDRGRVPA